MAWVSSRVYAQAGLKDTADALESLLQDTSCRRVEVVGDTPPPPMTLCHAGTWTAIFGATQWLSDLPLATRRLSRSLGRVVSCELFGHAFRLRVAEAEDGVETVSLRSPNTPWGAPELSMPLYDDVERKAFRVLESIAVPRKLILAGLEPLGCSKPVDLGPGLVIDDAGRKDVALASIDSTSNDAPVVPFSVAVHKRMVVRDHRYVEGKPSSAAVDRLLVLESELQRRAERAANAAIELTVIYHAGPYQQALDDMLVKRGRSVMPSPRRDTSHWWHFWKHFGFRRR